MAQFEDDAGITEQMWRTWTARDKKRERAEARKMRRYAAGIVFVVVTLSAGLYWFAR